MTPYVRWKREQGFVATDRVPLPEDPRFARAFDTVQREVTRTGTFFRDSTLRRLAGAKDATPEQERIATTVGFNAARACARRLCRYYGLRSRYA
jgi:hypothetical protein